jgi:hypothetical protein
LKTEYKGLKGGVYKSRLRFRCIFLTAPGKLIFDVSKHSYLLKWDMDNGTLQSHESMGQNSSLCLGSQVGLTAKSMMKAV